MSRAQVAVARLFARQKSRNGVTVTLTFRAGASDESTTTVTAVVGREITATDSPSGGSANIVESDRDYLIAVADLVDGETAVEPPEGMRITETINGVACVFEMMPLAGEPGWRYSDETRVMYRIHTKRVS